MDDLLHPMDVEAVEVYHGVTLPVEVGSDPCGAIVVWTRPGERDAGHGSFWKRFFFALTFLSLGYLLTR